MSAAEIRLECLKIAMVRSGAYDKREPLAIADELFAWVTDPAAAKAAAGDVGLLPSQKATAA